MDKIKENVKENIVMFRAFITEFKNTGTFFPSSKWAAAALSHPLITRNRHNEDEPRRILEIGAGTGPVTRKLLAEMREDDFLTVCEINPQLMKELQSRLAENPDFIRVRDRVEFFEGPVQDIPEKDKYDILVCALPFLNFERELVEDIFEKLLRLANNDAKMTYYEYIGLRRLGKVLPIKERKERINAVEDYLYREQSARHRGKQKIWFNVLPINIYTMDMVH